MSVVVIGDLNVDLELRLPAAADRRGVQEAQLAGGGSAANTAAALARLQVPTRFVGSVGDDGFGRFAVEDLAAAGVDTTAVVTSRDEPTVVVAVVVPPDGDRLIYVWPPRGGAHGALAPEDVPADLGEWVHVSGICLRTPRARGAILTAMERARAAGIPVSLDLNLRLENWGWEDGFRDVIAAAIERADVVLGSALDEIGAVAGSTDPVTAARAVAGEDRLVVARRGPAGAIACARGVVVDSPGFTVEVVDTVGAGDAFDAGFIAARLAGADIAETLRWGNATAALTIAGAGARSSPQRDAVETLLGGR